jgi:hypothetical protein
MDMHDGFTDAGFLSDGIEASIARIRAENAAWFQLAGDTNIVLMRAMTAAMTATKGTNWSREAVAVRILMRSSGTFQGVILLAERGMVAQSRMLVRSIIEDSFCAAGLVDKPDDIIKMLRDDAEASRRNQAKFIVAQQLGNSTEDLVRLEAITEEMDKKVKLINQKEMAKLGPMLPQYLNYQRLSDDSVHTSASSLNKHVAANADHTGWSYKLGPGQKDDNAATLHRALLATLPVGIVVTQIIPDPVNNAALMALAERFRTLSSGSTI